MALDMAKYRRIFLEESNDHLAEISRALLELEKEMSSVDAIDTIFRMAHSIKSMAASLGYDSVADLSHRMEDRMEGVRSAGCVRSTEELGLLFRCLETLEGMVTAVSEEHDPGPVDVSLITALSSEPEAKAEAPDATPGLGAPATGSDASEPTSPEAVGGEPKKVESQSPLRLQRA